MGTPETILAWVPDYHKIRLMSWTYAKQETEKAWRQKNKDKMKEIKRRYRQRQKEKKLKTTPQEFEEVFGHGPK